MPGGAELKITVMLLSAYSPNAVFNDRAAIAQLGERQTEDLKVPGSIPGLGIFVSPANMLHFCLSKERRLVKCISRESSPGHIDGNDVFYH